VDIRRRSPATITRHKQQPNGDRRHDEMLAGHDLAASGSRLTSRDVRSAGSCNGGEAPPICASPQRTQQTGARGERSRCGYREANRSWISPLEGDTSCGPNGVERQWTTNGDWLLGPLCQIAESIGPTARRIFKAWRSQDLHLDGLQPERCTSTTRALEPHEKWARHGIDRPEPSPCARLRSWIDEAWPTPSVP
jgi:hypothetical protein